MSPMGIGSTEMERYWAAVLVEVYGLPAEYRLTPKPVYSDAMVDVSYIAFESIGGKAIKGWMAVPRDREPRGIVIQFPAYATVLFPPVGFAAEGFIGVAIPVRGHHLSELAGIGFPGLLTAGLPGRGSYVYRSIYGDAIRATSLIRGLIGPSLPVALTGQSQGAALALVAAAMVDGVCAVGAEVPFLCSIRDALGATNAFPYRELNGWLREHPDQADEALATIDLIDVIGFACRVRCPVLMSIGTLDPVTPLVATRALGAALPNVEVIEYEGAGHEGGGIEHRIRQMRWLAERMETT